jgi:hypothetical protein
MGKSKKFKRLDSRIEVLIVLFLFFNSPILILIFLSGITTAKLFMKIVLDLMIIFVSFGDLKKIYFKGEKVEGGVER